MEDSHAILLNLDEGQEESNSFFAVYDGHGGRLIANYAGENVHKRLVKEEAYAEKRYEEALKKAFLGTDEDLLADPQYARDTSGCTAVAALVTKDKVYVANAGDSRSVLSVAGKVKALSEDHKPTNVGEKKRITNAGGYIESGRVNGNLALSRGIGDFTYKRNTGLKPEDQIITADPEISVHDITDEDEFLILACDGIWDCLESQEAVDFVRYSISTGKSLPEITEHMCDHIIAPDTQSGTGCDNMTVLVVALLNGRTIDEWRQWVTDRVNNKVGYETRLSLPFLYNEARVKAFWERIKDWKEEKARRDEQKARSSSGLSFDTDDESFGAKTLVLGSTGGISFHPGGSIMNDTGTLMFADEGMRDLEEGEEDPIIRGLGFGGLRDHSTLKAQIEAFELDGDDVDSSDDDLHPTLPDLTGTSIEPDPTGLSPSTESGSRLLPNGDIMKPIPPVEQLTSLPSGDEAAPVTQIEGLMDTSESPLKE